jgi:hypothetical protein
VVIGGKSGISAIKCGAIQQIARTKAHTVAAFRNHMIAGRPFMLEPETESI